MGGDVSGQVDALPWLPGDAEIAAEVTRALARGEARSFGQLLDGLPQYPGGAVRRVVLLLFRAGTLLVDEGGYPPRYRLV
jgi:hypothetical protein